MDNGGPKGRLPLLRSAPLTSVEDGPYLRIGGQPYALQGQDAQAVVERVLARVDGFATREEIAVMASQSGDLTPDWVEHVLRMLVEMGGCVVDQEAPGDRRLRQQYLAQITHFGQHLAYPTACQKRLQTSTVTVIGLEYIGDLLVQHLALAGVGHVRAVGNPILQAAEVTLMAHGQTDAQATRRHALMAHRLRTLGCPTRYEGVDAPPGARLDWDAVLSNCDLAVLVLPQPQSSLLHAFNQACLAQPMPYVTVWMEVTGAQVGPLVVPYETPCLLCMELRRRKHLSRDDFFAIQHQEEATMPRWQEAAFLLPWASTVASIAACEIVTALTPVSSTGELRPRAVY